MLKVSGTKRLKLEYDDPLSSFAFNFNLRRYYMAGRTFQERLLSRVTTSQPFVRAMGVRRYDNLLFSHLVGRCRLTTC